MKSAKFQNGDNYYLYDPEILRSKDCALVFAAEAQQSEKNTLTAGRGKVRLLQWQDNLYIERHSRRGGMVRWLNDRYLWPGLEQTRVWHEWLLLATLHDQGLAVPKPLLARVVKRYGIYRADLVTHYISETQTLAERLLQSEMSVAEWQSLGLVIKKFSSASVFHPDLNAHNILQSSDGSFWLIDFDRAQIKTSATDSVWRENMFLRLQRSLTKLAKQHPGFAFSQANWRSLILA